MGLYERGDAAILFDPFEEGLLTKVRSGMIFVCTPANIRFVVMSEYRNASFQRLSLHLSQAGHKQERIRACQTADKELDSDQPSSAEV